MTCPAMPSTRAPTADLMANFRARSGAPGISHAPSAYAPYASTPTGSVIAVFRVNPAPMPGSRLTRPKPHMAPRATQPPQIEVAAGAAISMSGHRRRLAFGSRIVILLRVRGVPRIRPEAGPGGCGTGDRSGGGELRGECPALDLAEALDAALRAELLADADRVEQGVRPGRADAGDREEHPAHRDGQQGRVLAAEHVGDGDLAAADPG